MTVSCTTSCASASVSPALSATPWMSRQYVSKNRCQLAWSSTSRRRSSRLARVEMEASVLKGYRNVAQDLQTWSVESLDDYRIAHCGHEPERGIYSASARDSAKWRNELLVPLRG